MEFLIEPQNGRFAFSTSAKVACVSVRMWMWELSGLPRTRNDIFEEFRPYTVSHGNGLPDSVQTIIAIHRDGVSRLRSVYDHRIREERNAPDNGLDHFARHLPEYCAIHADIGHHCRAQSSWLGSEPRIFTDILPLDHLHLLPELLGKRIGQTLPPLARHHVTSAKSPVSEEAEYWFRHWTSHDTALGWDGKTLRVKT